MPSTYTLNNGIELIATGEQSGTWGDTTNTNLSLVDTALDGQVTVTLPSAGTSGSPNTLAISDGAASDGRNRMVIFNDGGDLGATAYVQLTPNDAEKIIYVRNDLAGSRSIILFQGTYNASNDYELPAGTTAVIYFDGAGSGAVAANVFNNAYFDSLRLGSVSVTEIIDDDTMATAAATNIATSESIKAYVDAQVGANNELSEVLANGNTTGGTDISVSSGDDITFADSSKAIFGAGSDLQIYHDGSNSRIADQGVGGLILQGDAGVYVKSSDNTETMAQFVKDGEVSLWYDNSSKLATTSTGVDITGTLTSSQLTVSSSGTANSLTLTKTDTNATKLVAGNTDGTHTLEFNNGGMFISDTTGLRWGLSSDGDITFYDTSGNASFVYDESAGSTFNENGDNKDFRVESDGQTHMLFVDASTNRVGINNNAPQAFLHVNSGDGSGAFRVEQTNPSAGGNAWQSLFEDDSSADQGSGNSMVYINSNRPNTSAGQILRVLGNGKSSDYFNIYDTGEVVVNQSSLSTSDFRVESNSNSHMLFVDAGNNRIGINAASPQKTLEIVGDIQLDATDASLWLKSGAAGTSGYVNWTFNTDDTVFGFVGIDYDTRASTGFTIDSGYPITLDATMTTSYGLDIRNGGAALHRVKSDLTVFNILGADNDFRVESVNSSNMLFVDAAEDRVEIKRTDVSGFTPNSTFDLLVVENGTSNTGSVIQIVAATNAVSEIGFSDAVRNAGLISFSHDDDIFSFRISNGGGGYIFNDDGVDADFRIESDTKSHAFFMNAGSSLFGIGTSTPYGELHIVESVAQAATSSETVGKGIGDKSLILQQRHNATQDSVVGYLGAMLEFRSTNDSNTWSTGQIYGLVDPNGGTNHDGGLGFYTNQGGAAGSTVNGINAGGNNNLAMLMDAEAQVIKPRQVAFFARPPAGVTTDGNTIIGGTWGSITNQGGPGTGSQFSSSGVFTAPRDGWYHIHWTALVGTTTDARTDFYLTKNDTEVARSEINGYTTTSANRSGAVTAILYLNSSDYIKFGIRGDAGSATYGTSSPWGMACGYFLG
jgi:hypothetical protein